MKNLFKLALLILTSLFVYSCNRNLEDTTELWKNANTTGEIINRSGTDFNSANNKELALSDAQNRLQSGGGLFGKKAGIDLFGESSNSSSTTIGMPINPYLWKGSLETVDFMPLSSADPFGGIIITDWYTKSTKVNERCKLNIFIKGLELNSQNIKVKSFCQSLINNEWVNSPTNEFSNVQLENAILNKAKKIKLSQG
jgi:hypothetical protein